MISTAITRKYALGFSLVEVVLCLGVVGFAFVALLGLLPLGLKTFRQAMETSIQSQIAQQISSELQQVRFSDLTSANYASSHFPQYFDDQGMAVSGPNDPNRIYTVTAAAPTTPNLPGINGANPTLLVFQFFVQARNSPETTNRFSVVVTDKGI